MPGPVSGLRVLNKKGLLRGSLFIILFSLSQPLRAQVESEDYQQKENELKVQLGVIVPRYSYEIKASSDASKKMARLQPHNPNRTALGLSYQNIGARISFANPNKDEEKQKYGNSQSTDIQFRFFGRNTYEFFYQAYKGYFFENSEELDPSFVSRSDKIQRSDIKTRNWGFNYYHSVHEKDYSQAIAFDQLISPPETGWGTSWMVHGSQSSIEGNSALVPAASQSDFGLIGGLEGLKRTTLAGGVGIGGLAAYENFYATAFIAVGLGYQNYRVDYGQLGNKQNDSGGAYSSYRFGLGYNGPRHVSGIQVLSDSVSTSFAKGEVIGQSLELSFFYAYRFDDVDIKWLKSTPQSQTPHE